MAWNPAQQISPARKRQPIPHEPRGFMSLEAHAGLPSPPPTASLRCLHYRANRCMSGTPEGDGRDCRFRRAAACIQSSSCCLLSYRHYSNGASARYSGNRAIPRPAHTASRVTSMLPVLMCHRTRIGLIIDRDRTKVILHRRKSLPGKLITDLLDAPTLGLFVLASARRKAEAFQSFAETNIEGEWEGSSYFTPGCEKRVKYNFAKPERCAKPSLDSSS
jgi:hypothetical protein